MVVSTTVTLAEGEQFALGPEEVAAAVLQALGGDPATDYAEAHVHVASLGSVGEHPGVALAAADNEARAAAAGQPVVDERDLAAPGMADYLANDPGIANDDAVANDDAPVPEDDA
jgi:hypothetical protein